MLNDADERPVETPYDFIAVLLFSGLVVLFLQRSVSSPPKGDSLWQYLVASVGCALFNFVGNKGLHIWAMALLVGILVFIALVLRPFYPRQ
jgi:hypothetical protein